MIPKINDQERLKENGNKHLTWKKRFKIFIHKILKNVASIYSSQYIFHTLNAPFDLSLFGYKQHKSFHFQILSNKDEMIRKFLISNSFLSYISSPLL